MVGCPQASTTKASSRCAIGIHKVVVVWFQIFKEIDFGCVVINDI
ncbi:Uncharacterised protein [Mycobacterium tuberculosis]|nr:Uncharacterised protein [Mycobacterium tuberculosis]